MTPGDTGTFDYVVVGGGSTGLCARGPAVRGPGRHGVPARGRAVRCGRLRRSCSSPTGWRCSTPATTGTTSSNRRSTATASCATRGRRCSAGARRTTRASRSGRRARTSTSGPPAGCEGWSADECWPLIARLENNDGPWEGHGRSGPVTIMQIEPDDPCGVAVLEAAAAVGLPTVRFNEGVTVCEGAGFFQINREPDGTRASSSRAYLHPIMGKRPNLEVRTGAWASTRAVRRHGRATGVEYQQDIGPGRRTVTARREVVLYGGRDRQPEAAHAVRHRPGRAPARVRRRRTGRRAGRRREPGRPRRGPGDVGGRAADGHALHAVVGDRAVHPHRRPAWTGRT